MCILPCRIREQDPLKQGLKQSSVNRHVPPFNIREQDPLKQGLKPHFRIINLIDIFGGVSCNFTI